MTGDSPTGLTFVAPFLADREMLGYAFAFEQRTDARVPPAIVTTAMPAGDTDDTDG